MCVCVELSGLVQDADKSQLPLLTRRPHRNYHHLQIGRSSLAVVPHTISVATLRLPDESPDSVGTGFAFAANPKSGARSGGSGNSGGDGWLNKVLEGRWFTMSARYVALIILKPMVYVVGEIRRGFVLCFERDGLFMIEPVNQRACLCLLFV